jgi:glycosyltransferase involved in cell wall biosynthesis
MKILMLTNYYPPEVAGVAYLCHELAEALVDRGHTVDVVTGFPRYHLGKQRQNGLLRFDRIDRCRVIRVANLPFDVGNPIARGIDHLYLALSFLVGGLIAGKADIVITNSPPMPPGITAWALSRLWRVPYVISTLDLFPQYAIDIGVLKNPLAIRFFEAMERFIYRTAAGITMNSPGSRRHVVARGAPAERVHPISNWVDIDFLRPGPKANGFRAEHGLDGTFVVQYAGTFGWQQDLDTVIDAAALLADRDDIRFQLFGDGVELERLQSKVARMGLANVIFTPYQPRERYPEVLQSADACLVTLHKSVRTTPIPSKLLSIMAAGRPVIMVSNRGIDAPALMEEAGCGVWVPPGSPEQLAEAVLQLQSDPERTVAMGRVARAYAECEFGIDTCVDRFEQVLVGAVAANVK